MSRATGNQEAGITDACWPLTSIRRNELQQAERYQLRSLQIQYERSAETEKNEPEDASWDRYKELKQLQRGGSSITDQSVSLLKSNLRKHATDAAANPPPDSFRGKVNLQVDTTRRDSAGAASVTHQRPAIMLVSPHGNISSFQTLQSRVNALRHQIETLKPEFDFELERLALDVENIANHELRQVGQSMVALVRDMGRLCRPHS